MKAVILGEEVKHYSTNPEKMKKHLLIFFFAVFAVAKAFSQNPALKQYELENIFDQDTMTIQQLTIKADKLNASYFERLKKLHNVWQVEIQYNESSIDTSYSAELLQVFHQMPKLRFLYVRIVSAEEMPQLVDRDCSTECMMVSFGKITFFPENSFSSGNLKTLSIVGSQIDQFDVNWSLTPNLRSMSVHTFGGTEEIISFEDLNNLHSLSIENDSWTKLPNSFLKGNQNISALTLKLPQLKELNGSFFELTSLQNISIESNELREIPNSIEKLQQLYQLDLKTPRLSKLPPSLEKLPQLTGFSLSILKSSQLEGIDVIFRCTGLLWLELYGIDPAYLFPDISSRLKLKGLWLSLYPFLNSNLDQLKILKNTTVRTFGFETEYFDLDPDNKIIIMHTPYATYQDSLKKLKKILPKRMIKYNI